MMQIEIVISAIIIGWILILFFIVFKFSYNKFRAEIVSHIGLARAGNVTCFARFGWSGAWLFVLHCRDDFYRHCH
ncbi:hypothetical protein [Janthinobacterium sp. LB3P112]|uniref:hypothetical protein n=1 Tax=Janthinobacterium sp. LB3P112 TaxID=3424196 RepID=UPI003F51AFA9